MPDTPQPAPTAGAKKTREQMREEWIALSDMTADEFDALQATYQARATGMPMPGEDAPGFTVDIMDQGQKRTGESKSLSDFRGKPVGLIFGSYT
ncbi:MAG: hypothetical protein HOO19_19440 [Rhodospirillaceae bacterium]|jgi:hypothetical protein|nr:hypothetical protein [Rhodospirillaceae bacterium]MBT3883287.1 hypothetical protein [Rhodospirillaceae bacterium]MBT4117289.1 hypothetical protein [Rhodospirillaceae bacterium]MBT4671243.1 hypothetical protein [Rhodospirillaceae bacterium]MBT4751514.1 hypothetical protein [Rhodospirillaceae bacterium]